MPAPERSTRRLPSEGGPWCARLGEPIQNINPLLGGTGLTEEQQGLHELSDRHARPNTQYPPVMPPLPKMGRRMPWHAGAIVGYEQSPGPLKVLKHLRIQRAKRWSAIVSDSQHVDCGRTPEQGHFDAWRDVLI